MEADFEAQKLIFSDEMVFCPVNFLMNKFAEKFSELSVEHLGLKICFSLQIVVAKLIVQDCICKSEVIELAAG